MNRFTPVMCQVPSSACTALVRPAPTSEPASGSVSTIVAPHWRSTMCWAIFLSRSLPLRNTMLAKLGPQENIHTAGFEPSTISATDQASVLGTGWPPRSGSSTSRNHSASIQAW